MYSFDCLINALRAAVTVGTSAHKISQQKKKNGSGTPGTFYTRGSAKS